MKKVLIVVLIGLTLLLCGCVSGNRQNTVKDKETKYDILLNSGTVFVYTFQDPKTGVWYICNEGDVEVRINNDGTRYTGE